MLWYLHDQTPPRGCGGFPYPVCIHIPLLRPNPYRPRVLCTVYNLGPQSYALFVLRCGRVGESKSSSLRCDSMPMQLPSLLKCSYPCMSTVPVPIIIYFPIILFCIYPICSYTCQHVFSKPLRVCLCSFACSCIYMPLVSTISTSILRTCILLMFIHLSITGIL